MFLLVLSIPRLLSRIQVNQKRNDGTLNENIGEDDELRTAFEKEHYHFVSYIIFFITSALILILNCFADSEPQQMKYAAGDKPCPELCASFPSKLLFHWFDKFVWMGYRRPLENDDLWHMNPEDTSTEVTPKFLKYWNQTVAKNSQIEPAPAVPSASYQKETATVAFSNGKCF
jgi:ATP-binding cassette subfamily C (CFTR/MRP) protein 1